jgi:hypothetical protein
VSTISHTKDRNISHETYKYLRAVQKSGRSLDLKHNERRAPMYRAARKLNEIEAHVQVWDQMFERFPLQETVRAGRLERILSLWPYTFCIIIPITFSIKMFGLDTMTPERFLVHIFLMFWIFIPFAQMTRTLLHSRVTGNAGKRITMVMLDATLLSLPGWIMFVLPAAGILLYIKIN